MMGESNLEQSTYGDIFRSYRVPHPILGEATRLVVNRVQNGPYQIINVLGPAGVGKTNGLIPAIVSELSLPSTKHDSNPGHIPVITVRAPAQSRRVFNWSKFYTRALEAGKHPITHKIRSGELEQAFINLIKNRQPTALIVDEAQHFTNVTPKSAAQQLDYLKDLIADLDVKVVLVGNYELRNYAFANDQIGRRNNNIVHFSRYRLRHTIKKVTDPTGKIRERDVEATQFRNIVFSLGNTLPVKTELDLADEWHYFYVNTLGCVGILKDWLEEALRNALAEERGQIGLEYIKQFAPSERKIEALWSCIDKVEDEIDASCKTLAQKTRPEPSHDTADTEGDTPKLMNKHPGTRNPWRDPVGDQQSSNG